MARVSQLFEGKTMRSINIWGAFRGEAGNSHEQLLVISNRAKDAVVEGMPRDVLNNGGVALVNALCGKRVGLL